MEREANEKARLYAAVEWTKLGKLIVRIEHHSRHAETASGKELGISTFWILRTCRGAADRCGASEENDN